MARSTAFQRLAETIRKAIFLDERGLETQDGLQWIAEREGLSRREFLAGSLATAALAGCAMDVDHETRSVDRETSSVVAASGDVGIVGAGLAGPACARELGRYRLSPTLHEGSDRVGGRVFSLGALFPGQVAERGGELIDTTHTTIRGFAREFGLRLENYVRQPGEVSYFFDGRDVPEAAIVDEYRAFVSAMRSDLRTLTPPTAARWTEADRALDYFVDGPHRKRCERAAAARGRRAAR